MRLIDLVEGKAEIAALKEAAWWYERWVMGSIRDPDWDERWLSHVHDLPTAFRLLKDKVGGKKVAGKVLWRFLSLPNERAKLVTSERILLPRDQDPRMFGSFTSFTAQAKIVPELIEWFGVNPGEVGIIVSAKIPAEMIVTSHRDMKAKGLLGASAEQDFLWQDEVIVDFSRPLKLSSARVI